MIYPSIPSAQTIVQHCKERGIKNIVISPGSRNAPLTIGFSENPFFSCFSIVDERCAAFFALGIAQQTREPVVICCTSGSALLNYYPAIAEAFYSQIPLVVISADRPPYKIDVGDGQTIRQDDVFLRHIGYSTHLQQDVIHATDRLKTYVPDWLEGDAIDVLQTTVQRKNDQALNNALHVAMSSQLPVHINVPFEEPLYDKVQTPSVVVDGHPLPDAAPRITKDKLREYAERWNATDRKLILVGVNYPDTISQECLNTWANDPSVLVLTETTSNLHHPNFFPSIDSLLAPLEKIEGTEEWFSRLRPKILLTFGGLIVSKKIKAFLRGHRPEEHWHIDPIKAYDTFFSLSQHFKITPNLFFDTFLKYTKPVQSDYFPFWNSIRKGFEMRRDSYLKQIPFSDMLAFGQILKAIPEGYQLQLANSSTVRYAQLFALDPSLTVFCNRGTSGIDGSTSTAIGAALYHSSPTVFLTGDLSFFYDSNGLWNEYIRDDFRIVLFNNSGGGIFRILPGKEQSENFEHFFETKHNLTAGNLCEMFGFEHIGVADEESLVKALKSFFEQGKAPKLLEISTPRLLNDKILLTYFDFISSVFINH
ncbi:2-succinyl-5-enolpyruvyl-6-hydroxy-3-cyclohexene-1-carboxylic-acid synthase [Maribacter sp. 2-571]|uniref:2-succinyl-5-enolpyruvyl-6-hydroxy-3- cyclohexene-1-carboxylic-acid synthase n=1 Tax=Maribacter sp. 2-571 TaxID=3417569 RepID=UPI003D338448